MLSAPESVGDSKSGAAMKLNAPVVALIVNRPWSAPPARLKVSVAPASGSLAVTVVTAVVFSAMLAVALVPPPPEVIATGSLVLVTVTAMAWVSVSAPSETWTTTS